MAHSSESLRGMYKCRFCDKKFEQPQSLALHEKQHDYKFPCRFCARRMKTEREFLRHEATHAESSTPISGNKARGNQSPKTTSNVPEIKKVSKDGTKSPKTSRAPGQNDKFSIKEENFSSNDLRRQVLQTRPSSSENRRPITPDRSQASPHRETSNQERVAVQASEKSSELQKIDIDDVFKKAALYDEVFKRCEEMEKEIKALKTKYDLSDSEDSDDENKEIEERRVAVQDPTKNDDAYEISDSEVILSAVEEDGMNWDADDKTVPKEWKVGKFKDGRRAKVFKSPEGFIFQNRVKALEFMMHGSYPENLMSLMRNNLNEDGWLHDRSCPVRWKTRKLEGKEGGVDFEYLSPTFEVIPSMQEMLEFMKENRYDLRSIKKLEDKMKLIGFEKVKVNRELTEIKRNEMKNKTGDDILPPGWSRKMIGQSNVFVSPGGTIMHTIQQVLNAVESSNTEQTVIEQNKEVEKPAVAEKRKSEDLFVSNKKGRIESKKKGDMLSGDQIKTLEEMHSKSLYPNSENIKFICNSTNLVESEVKKWFVKRAAEQSRSVLKSRSRNTGGQGSPHHGRVSPSPSTDSFDPHPPSLISQQHITALTEIFRAKPNPTAENFRQIADRLGIEKQLIINWFRKKRTEPEVRTCDDRGKHQTQVKAAVNTTADKNDIMTEDQVTALQLVLARTKTPSHSDYKSLVRATGLSRLKIERWFNFHK